MDKLKGLISNIVVSSWLSIGSASTVFARDVCASLFGTVKTGAQFLNEVYPDLHREKNVNIHINQVKRTQIAVPRSSQAKIEEWLNYHKYLSEKHENNNQVLNRIKSFYILENVTKLEAVPQTFFDHLKKVSRERGESALGISMFDQRNAAVAAIQSQKKSLEAWLDYFFSKDSFMYPNWVKYWVFRSVTQMGKFDVSTSVFKSRDSDTMAPFPELNPEALALVLETIVQKTTTGIMPTNPDAAFLKLVESQNFRKLYGHVIGQLVKKKISDSTQGQWKIFDKGSDAKILSEALRSKGTGWCTAGESVAQSHLEIGDFHVFFTYDEGGRATVPRVAIRMNGSDIAEVRGVDQDQRIDKYIEQSNVVTEKMREFGERGKAYIKKSSDMAHLTKIERLVAKNEKLSSEQLRFLYEIDSKIWGFGHHADPRVVELRQPRSVKDDIAVIFSVNANEVSLTSEEAVTGNFKVHYGDLTFSDPYMVYNKAIMLPSIICGSLSLAKFQELYRVSLPSYISGNLDLPMLSKPTLMLPGGSSKVIELPSFVGGDLNIPTMNLIHIFAHNLKIKFPTVGGKYRIHDWMEVEDGYLQAASRFRTR